LKKVFSMFPIVSPSGTLSKLMGVANLSCLPGHSCKASISYSADFSQAAKSNKVVLKNDYGYGADSVAVAYGSALTDAGTGSASLQWKGNASDLCGSHLFMSQTVYDCPLSPITFPTTFGTEGKVDLSLPDQNGGALHRSSTTVQERFVRSGNTYIAIHNLIDGTLKFSKIGPTSDSTGSGLVYQSTPQWLLNLGAYTAKSIAVTQSDGLIVRVVTGGGSVDKFYLVNDPLGNTATPITDAAHPIGDGGAFFTAPCRAASCIAGDQEYAYLWLSGATATLKYGVLNVNSATLTPAGSTQLSVDTGIVGKDLPSIHYFASLLPKYRNSVNSGIGTFVIADPHASTFTSYDLFSGSAGPTAQFGISGGAIDSLLCIESTNSCFIGDSGNQGIWRLK
jgi:hypothetical protein